MKLHISQPLVCVLLMGSLISCFKGDLAETGQEQKTLRYVFSKEELAYLQIPDNRIFVYKDSATGSADSVKLLSFGLYTAYGLPPGWSGPPFSAPLYEYQKLSFTLINLRDTSFWLEAISTDLGYFGDASPTISGSLRKLNWNGTIFSSCYPPFEMTVENKTYKEVVRFPYDLNESDDEFWWAKGVGIIKISIKDSSKVFTYTLCN